MLQHHNQIIIIMNNSIKIFSNQEFGNIRTAGTFDEPLFCLIDVCKALNIVNYRNVKRRLDKEDVHQVDTLTNGGRQSITFINESGLYTTILRSESDRAKHFRKWVTSTVLPSIRKTGMYGGYNIPQTKAEALRLAADLAEKVETQQKIIEQQTPLANLGDAVMKYDDDITIAEMAKILDQNGFRTGDRRFRQLLREDGYLLRNGQPSQKAMNANILAIAKVPYETKYGREGIYTKIMVTTDGQKFFTNKYLKDIWNN